MRIKEKTVIVTGASRGIGRALACAFGAEKANVVCCARDTDMLGETAGMVRAAGGRALEAPADITEITDVDRVVSSALDKYGQIDILFNNAGRFESIGAVWETEPENWLKDVTVNLYGSYLFCRAVLPHMIDRNEGIIINMNGGRPTGGTGYAAGKAGLMELSRILIKELQTVNSEVIVLTAGPGLVDTEMTRKQANSAAGRRWIPSTGEKIASARTRSAEDIALKTIEICQTVCPELTGLNYNPDTELPDNSIASPQ